MLLAAAAAILMWWVWPPSNHVRGAEGEGPKTEAAALEPIPSYELSTDGGLERVRDGDSDPGRAAGAHRYRRDTKFEWVLRPESRAEGELALRAFAFVEGSPAGLALSLDELVRISDSGSIRVAGSIASLDLEPGRYTIALALGRPSALPERAEVLAGATNADTWTVRRLDILIEG